MKKKLFDEVEKRYKFSIIITLKYFQNIFNPTY